MSAIATIVTTILLPVLFWAAYHYYKDRHRPEPILKLVICLGLGALSTVLAHWAYEGLGYFNLRFDAIALGERSTLGLFAYAVLAIGVIEETAKFIPFFFVALRFKEFDERIDGIVYASFIALGFAAFENLRYLEFVSTTEALARGFSSTIVHIMLHPFGVTGWVMHILKNLKFGPWYCSVSPRRPSHMEFTTLRCLDSPFGPYRFLH